MKVSRGDIVLADFPFSTGPAGKLRPVLVVQANYYNQRIENALVAMVTTNLKNARDKAHCLIAVATTEGQQSGLKQDSLVSCINVVSLHESRLRRTIGHLSDQIMDKIESCLKAAFGMS